MTEAVPENLPLRDHRPWYRRWAPGWRMITVLAVLLLATPVSVRWYRLWWLPDVPAPFDVEAFNEIPAAAIGNEEHAFTHFQKAVFLHKTPPKWSDFWQWFADQPETVAWNDLPDEIRQWVIDQRPVIEHFRRGGRCAIGQMHLPRSYNFLMGLPLQQEVRGLERLAHLDALRLLHDGQTQEAAELLHDTYRAHRLLGQRGCNIERLIGIACHAVMMKPWQAWCRHPNVTAEELEAALSRLRQDWQMTAPPSDAFKVEYFSVINELKYPMTNVLDIFDSSVDSWAIRRVGLSTAPLTNSFSAKAKGWQIPFLWIAGEPERSTRGARLWLTHQLRTCDLPRAAQPPLHAGMLRLPDTPELTGGLTATQLNDRLEPTLLISILPASEQMLRATWAEAGRQTLLELELELQILIRRQGIDSRESLEAVLENYAWPVDPSAADGTPIWHRFTDDGLKLWSLSWNGTDQDGATESKGQGIDSVVVIPWPTERDSARE